MDDVADTLRDLALAHARLVRYSPGSSDGSDGGGLPFNEAAGAAAKRYADVIMKWQGKYADHLRIPIRWLTPESAAGWISRTMATRGVGRYPEAGRMVDALLAAQQETRAHMDRGASTWYAGPCSGTVQHAEGEPTPCTALLYAPAEYGDFTCRRCGSTYTIESRRDYLLAEVGCYRLTAAEAARAIVVLTDYDRGESRLSARIRQWAKRDRITAYEDVREVGQARPTYLVSDILRLLDEDGHAASGLDRVTRV